MKEEKPKRANTRAASNSADLWMNLTWSCIESKVNKLQSRIAKAVKQGRFNLAKKLQYLLVNSFYAKLLAIKRISQNKGKNTAGIDGVLWNSPSKKYNGELSLESKGYKASPLKRTNGKKRPLGIPTIYDRAMQALYLLSLDPVAETLLDEKSFGFRKYRGVKDACANLFNLLAKKTSAKWILEGDVKACFDEISHKWLLNNIMLKQFLKSGFVYSNRLFSTNEGSPQGGIISPVLANLALNRIGDLLRNRYWKSKRGMVDSRYNTNKINIVVYADDIVITADNKDILTEIKSLGQ